MEWNVVSWVLNGLLGLGVYLLKTAHNDIKDELKAHQKEIDSIKDNYLRKEDFKEFRDELWRKLDKIENSVEAIRDR